MYDLKCVFKSVNGHFNLFSRYLLRLWKYVILCRNKMTKDRMEFIYIDFYGLCTRDGLFEKYLTHFSFFLISNKWRKNIFCYQSKLRVKNIFFVWTYLENKVAIEIRENWIWKIIASLSHRNKAKKNTEKTCYIYI